MTHNCRTAILSLREKVDSLCDWGAGKRCRTLENRAMTRLRMIGYVVTAGLVLCLSACTNPYDPVQRFIGGGLIGAGSGAAIGAAAAGGHGAALGARSAERWVQWGALSQRHHRPLITATTITDNTAMTITNTTRATNGANIIVLTVDKRAEVLRRLRQIRPRSTEGSACARRGGGARWVLGIRARQSLGTAPNSLFEVEGKQG